jgi:hypothetical protein
MVQITFKFVIVPNKKKFLLIPHFHQKLLVTEAHGTYI